MQQFTSTLLSRRAYDYHHVKKKGVGGGGAGLGEGATVLELKWRRWSNGSKNQNSKKSLELPTKPPKIPGPKINPPKIPFRVSEPWKFPKTIKWHNMLYFFGFTLRCRTTKPGYADTTTSLQIVLNTQRNPYSNQATPKQYLPNFPTPKIPKSKISNHPKSFDHPCYFRSGVPPRIIIVVNVCENSINM